ncbi:MAG: efflux RND transporter permease subunit [Alphaproteobacteria bacterium]
MTSDTSKPASGKHLFTDAHAVAFTRWVIRWRWAVIFLCLVAAAAAASGGRFLGFASDYRVFFSSDNPQLEAFEAMQRVYSKDDNISFVIKPAEGEIFTPELLASIRDLTDAAWKIPFSTRVDSLTNFQHSYAEGDDLTVRDLVPASMTLDAAAIAEIRDVAMSDPLLINRTISPDGTTTNINVTLALPQKDVAEIPAAMAYARDLADKFRAEHPGARVALTGLVALNSAFFEASMKDMSSLVPMMYGVLLLMMVLFLRSVSGTFATLLVIGLSAATAMGLAGWFGIRLTPPSAVAPTVILTIAIADSIHILVSMFKAMRHGMEKREAIVEAMRINFGPVFLTSLTTIIGFSSLNFSDAPPFADLGNITSMGVAGAWAYSILFLPALMAVLPVRVKAKADGRITGVEHLAEFVIRNRRSVLFATVALAVGLGAMVPRTVINDEFVGYFDESIPFRTDTDFASENLSGIYQLQWSLPAVGPGGISEPEYLRKIEAFNDWLRTQPGVVHVQTLTDIFRRLNKNMHADDPAWYKLPGERDLAAQYLLLFEMSLPYGLDLNNQINVDKSALRVIATTDNITTNDLRAFDVRAGDWLQANVTSQRIDASGPIMMFAYITQRNMIGMLTGTAMALVLISFSLTFALRNIRLGIISLVPNLLPAIMAFGIWAIVVGQVDVASSIVTATSLGIIVDATVHFLSKYQRARREKNLNAEDAVRYAFSTVGVALLVTAVILIAGFAVLAFSAFKLNESMGILTAITIAVALIADFLLLPALLLTVDRRQPTNREDAVYAERPAPQAAQ